MASTRVTIQIARDVHARLAAEAEKPSNGRSMNDVASRVLAWFCRQRDVVQTAVVSGVDEGMERAYAEALRRLANELDPPPAEPVFSGVVDHGDADPAVVQAEWLRRQRAAAGNQKRPKKG